MEPCPPPQDTEREAEASGTGAAALLGALARDRRNLPALLAQAETLFAASQREAAVTLLEAANRLAPDEFRVLRTLSGFLAVLGQFEDAERLAARAVELAPDSAEARLHLASLMFTRQCYQPAIPHLLIHVGHPQATPAGWHLLSIAMSAIGQPQRALETIRRAIELHGTNTDYRLHLASLLTSRAHYGDALTELGIAATIAPCDARIPRAASGNHEALGDLAAAYQEASRARDLAPDEPEIEAHYHQLSRQMGFIGRTADATGKEALTASLAGWAESRQRRRATRRNTSLRHRLAERSRIIHAIILRDMRTRYSQSHLGYIWAVFEPISHLLTLGIMFALINQAPPPVGNSLFEYYCTGLLPYLMFSHIATEVMTARAAGSALLMLPKIRTTDVIFAKTFLNLATEILVGIIVFTAFGAAGYRVLPAHLFPCATAVLLLALLGMGIGTLNMVIQNFFHAWETLFSAIIRLLYFASGIYYSPISMPDSARAFLEWNPILQGVELFRAGFFPEYNPVWIDLPYLGFWVLTSLLLGFGLEQSLRRRLKRQT